MPEISGATDKLSTRVWWGKREGGLYGMSVMYFPVYLASSCSHILQFRAVISLFLMHYLLLLDIDGFCRLSIRGREGHKVIKISKNNYRYIISRCRAIITTANYCSGVLNKK